MIIELTSEFVWEEYLPTHKLINATIQLSTAESPARRVDLWDVHARTAARLVCDVTALRHSDLDMPLDHEMTRVITQVLFPE
jgi:hypothetical protein